MKIYNSLFSTILFFIMTTMVGCKSDSDSGVSFVYKQQIASEINKNSVEARLWRGEAKGYISQGKPLSNNIEFLIRLAQVSAAVDNYSKFVTQSTKAKTSVMTVFWKIEAASSLGLDTRAQYASIVPILKAKNIQLFEEELLQLATPESISALANKKYEKSDVEIEMQKSLTSIEYRLSDTAFETSSFQDVMYASSALLRKAGKMMEKAVSVEGRLLDKVLFEKARSLITSTRIVKPSHCKLDNEITETFRGSVAQLENKFQKINQKKSGFSEANAGDVYRLANSAFQMGKSSSSVSACATPMYLSQK